MSMRRVMPSAVLLARMQAGEIPAGADDGRWGRRWTIGGEPCGRAVEILRHRGLAEVMVFANMSAACNLTEAGRAAAATGKEGVSE